jgi:hypothetical protein
MLVIRRFGRDDRVQRRQAAGALVVCDDLADLIEEGVFGDIPCGRAHAFIPLPEHFGEELIL